MNTHSCEKRTAFATLRCDRSCLRHSGRLTLALFASGIAGLALLSNARAQAVSEDVVESITTDPDSRAINLSGADDDNTIETIAAPGPSAALPVPQPASSERVTASAWALEEAHLTLGTANTQPPHVSVPFDRVINRTRLYARIHYARARSFELAASGIISYGLFVQSLRGTLAGDINAYSTRSSFEPRLGELYLGVFTSWLDLRIGQQRIAWGRADTQSPNDVLNARDQRDPFAPETELTQIPTPLARMDLDLVVASLQLVLTPIFQPDYFDLYGSNWAFIQPNAPSGFRGFFHQMTSLVDPSLFDRFNRLVQQTRLPMPTLRDMSAGAKLSTSISGVDIDLYYHYGFDRTPRLTLAPEFANTLVHSDFSRATVADFGPFFASIQSGYPPLSLEYVRRHHAGIALGTTFGPIGMRIDAAYDTQRVFFRTDLTGAVSRALQTTLSLEFQTGDVRKLFILEASVLHLFDIESGLLFTNRDTITLTGVMRVPLIGALDAEVRVLGTLQPRGVALRPTLRWRATEELSVNIAGLWLSGDGRSTSGYFARNSEALLGLHYAF